MSEDEFPLPTPPDVFKAMMVVAHYLEEADYIDVLIGRTGGAIFYRECPLAARQSLLSECERLMNEAAKEKDTRLYFQGIVFDLCKTLDGHREDKHGTVPGNALTTLRGLLACMEPKF